MKMRKVFGMVLACIFVLSSLAVISVSAAMVDKDVLTDNWVIGNDEGPKDDNNITVADGKITFAATTPNWHSVSQTLTVAGGTRFKLVMEVNLSAGDFQIALVGGKLVDPSSGNGWTDGNANYNTMDDQGYNVSKTIERTIQADADVTSMSLWIKKRDDAAGTINSIKLLECDANWNVVQVEDGNQGGNDNDDTQGGNDNDNTQGGNDNDNTQGGNDNDNTQGGNDNDNTQGDDDKEEDKEEEPAPLKPTVDAKGNYLVADKWVAGNDGGPVEGDFGISVKDGKATFTSAAPNWHSISQKVVVKPGSKYRLSIDVKLTSGDIQIALGSQDVQNATLNGSGGATDRNGNYSTMDDKGYGVTKTIVADIDTAASTDEYIEIIIWVKNRNDAGKAVGTIESISLWALDANNEPILSGNTGSTGTGTSPNTGVAFPMAALCATVISGAAVVLSKKRK